MMDTDTIEAGRDAWQRLQVHHRAAWSLWVAVGSALQVGKEAALVAAEAKSPHGKRYTSLFGTWLRENGLDGISQQARYRLLKCMDHLDEIETWRAGLDEAMRNRINHPDSIWFGWRRDVEGQAARHYARPYRPPHVSGKACNGGGYHRPIHFSQDVIRRAAMAMREHWHSGDVFKIAAIALAAAIRHEDDLMSLLPPPPKPRPMTKPAPLRIAAPAVLELT
jgi:hypothetical protein